ncbi:hypothetical protein M8494_11615 [Serratia ureilytica]
MLWRAYRPRHELARRPRARGEVHYGYDAEGRLLQHREPNQGKPRAACGDLADNLPGEGAARRGRHRRAPAAGADRR